jgi:hypothetical protein
MIVGIRADPSRAIVSRAVVSGTDSNAYHRASHVGPRADIYVRMGHNHRADSDAYEHARMSFRRAECG